MIFETVKFSDITVNHDKKRIPLSTMERSKRQGSYRYYGAQGVIDYIDDYIFDGKYLLIAEDGENLKSKKQNIAQLAEGQFWVNNHAHIVQCNERCRLEYLCFMLNSMDLSGYITGSAQPKLSQANMNNISFEIPSIEMQDLILSVILPIEKRIAMNTAINENLYNQMIAIFNNAKSQYNWKEHKLEDVLLFFDHMRKPLSSRQRENMKRNYPYYGATSIVDYVENYIFEGTYILISEDGANVVDKDGHPLIQYTFDRFWVNNHAHIVKGKSGCSEALVFAFLGTINLNSIVTGAAQPKVNQANLRNFSALLPEFQEASQLSDIMNPLFVKMIDNDKENQRLAALRDTLLPKLMNGEIDVSAVRI